MESRKILTLIAAALLFVVLFIANKDEKNPGPQVQAPTNEPLCTGSGVVKVATNPNLGQYLTDADCRTLYIFSNDTLNKSNCLNDCIKNWPIFTYDNKDLRNYSDPFTKNLNIIDRVDGSMQYAWGNNALYYFKDDVDAGDTNGNGKDNLWSVLKIK